MKNYLKATALVAALAAGGAHASDFDFSYTFGDGSGSVVTGSLSGDLNGTFVENISNIHVFLNGTEFTGAPLYAASWNPITTNWDSAPAKISTDASLNNFIFADSNVPTDFGASNYFFFTNDATNGQAVFATNINTGDIGYDALQITGTSGTWSLQPAAVPLPAPALLFTSSLGLLGALRRRASTKA